MPIEVKNDFRGGLDLDTSLYMLPKNSYTDALNVTRDAIEGNNDMVITNIVGNRIVSFDFGHPGTVIGAYGNVLRNTVIFFRYNSDGYNGIYEYNNTTRTITKIFVSLVDSATDILNFTQSGKITSIAVYPRDEGDLLYFIDSLDRPTTLNITAFKADVYNPVIRTIIDVCTRPPLEPPDAIYSNDNTTRSNGLRNKEFRFKQLWVYDDFQQSTTSPISAMPIPNKLLDQEYNSVVTNNNVITLGLFSGGKNVKGVMVLMSYAEKTDIWSDFVVVEIVDKAKLSIADEIHFSYQFYNDSTYPVYDVSRSILLFDWVPDFAKCLDMPNGNYLAMGGVTEGYDNDLVPNVTVTVDTIAAGSGGSTGSLSVQEISRIVVITNTRVSYRFAGIPAVGTVINFKLRRLSDSMVITIGSYTTVFGDTIPSIDTNLEAAINATVEPQVSATSSPTTIIIEYFNGFWDTPLMEIVAPAVGENDNSIATWKWSTARNIGLIYFDIHGKTNGVVYNSKITFPAYAQNISQQPLIPFIHVEILHIPPIWAYSYQFAMTKEETQYIYWRNVGVNTTESTHLYFDVTNFITNEVKFPTTANVLNYQFQDGDRMRLIRRQSDGGVFSDLYDAAILGQVVNPVINNVATTGTFIKIRKIPPFDVVDYSSNDFVIELYRPAQQTASTITNQTFYEFGQQYYVLNPGTADRTHGQGQIPGSGDPALFDIYTGDAYFRLRTIAISETGIASFYVMDRNLVDFYISAVNSVDGRPNIIDENARTTFFGAVIRFSQAYQPNTNINALNRFFPNNIEEGDYSFGDILRLSVRDRFMRVYQNFKIGVIPLFSQVNKAPSTDAISVVTDRLLNPIQYYVGNYGIGTAPESLTSYNYADYCVDNNRGVILRISNDGVTVISVIYKINSWTTEHIPLRKGIYKTYGAFDQRLNNYIVALQAVVGANAVAYITIDTVGNTRDTIEVLINDPILGSISLGTYPQGSGDTNTTIFASSLADYLNNNPYGYTVSSNQNVVQIEARLGLGATINGGNRLSVIITEFIPYYLSTENGDNILTENSFKIIT